MSDDRCPGCRLPFPSEWCWESRLRCPLKYPPLAQLVTQRLMRYINTLEERIETLEARDESRDSSLASVVSRLIDEVEQLRSGYAEWNP